MKPETTAGAGIATVLDGARHMSLSFPRTRHLPKLLGLAIAGIALAALPTDANAQMHHGGGGGGGFHGGGGGFHGGGGFRGFHNGFAGFHGGFGGFRGGF